MIATFQRVAPMSWAGCDVFVGTMQARGRLSEWEVAKIAHDILQVLCECHRQNICYADIKPANFLLKRAAPVGTRLEAPPQVKVADFGCSQRVLQVLTLRCAASWAQALSDCVLAWYIWLVGIVPLCACT
jgi:serine/threonine protein kinase